MDHENSSSSTSARLRSGKTVINPLDLGPLGVAINPSDIAARSTGKRKHFVLDEMSAMQSAPLYRVTFETVLRQSIAAGHAGAGWGKSLVARPLGRPVMPVALCERGESR